ncbi:hypothetical protein [Pararhodobacter oceanensis]|uniref:hypothetical protein n=1 Tax=Pararhodobacter oceanensis TaxID=2172121 RepID=UPI003A902E71
MTEHVEILGLTRVAKPKPNKTGSTILAYFDCAARGLELAGCALVRTKSGGLVAWPPKLDGPADTRRGIKIEDDSLRHGMMLHAREAYRALGGTDAEYIGKSIPEGPRNAFAALDT